MMRVLYLWLLVAAAALAGCSDSETSAAVTCEPGEVAPCECTDGRASTAVCLDDGSTLQCACASAGEGCAPSGAVLDCECADGARGTQACLTDGSVGRCRCRGVSSDPDGPAEDGEDDDDPVPAQSLSQRCCHDLGACINDEFIDEESASLFVAAECLPADDMLCVPDQFANPAGFELQACRSIGGVEGRCLVDCLADGEALADLPRDLCAAHHRCAPCFDPFSGEDSGLCALSLDPGPREPATRFEACCDGLGTCVPGDLVPDDQRDLLGPDSCAPSTASLCTPDALLDPDGYVPASCRGAGDLEGRCLSTCLPLVADQAELLSRGSCDAAEACVPCFDPFSGEPTGVCDLPGDAGPIEPPMPFLRCCAELGTCIPTELVPDDQRQLLGPDTCGGGDALCAPDALLDPDGYVAPTCLGPGNQEGRCLADCLPQVAEQGGLLAQGSCDDAHSCVPCYDPLSGEATGICSLPGDPGPLLPPMPYERCCEGTGTCVPGELVPVEQRDLLGEDTCAQATPNMCTPNAFLAPDYVPPACDGAGDLEGRCLSTCLPLVADQIELLSQADCEDVQACVPCYDPFSGEATGACSLPGDPGPAGPPVTFAKCCEIQGRQEGTCIPAELLPEAQVDSLPQESCAEDTQRCVHESLLVDPPVAPPTCSAGFFGEGRCLRECMVEGGLAGLVSQQDCADNDLCVPCSILGNPTGVCVAP